MHSFVRAVAVYCLWLVWAPAARADDPLPSWNDGPRKQAILSFVARTTTTGSPEFVRAEDRLATFDNDGTLWCEQPVYVQVAFLLDSIRELAPKHPHWRTTPPFKAVIENDLKAVLAAGEKSFAELVVQAHADLTTEEYATLVRAWIEKSRHPRFDLPYTQLVYQPMLELLEYLRAHEFRCHIVSGGGIEFMRAWAEPVYGLPPERIIGSSVATKFELREGDPLLVRMARIDFIDDGPGKPVGIGKFIGRRPIAAFGNSDGDFEMLEYTTIAKGPRLGMIVHHTDAQREYAYDRDSSVGRLDRALDAAPRRGWWLIDMKSDWKAIFPPTKESKKGE